VCSQRISFALFAYGCLLLSSAIAAPPEKEPVKNPLEGARPGDSLDSGYLSQPLMFEGGTKAHEIKLQKADGKDKVTVILDPNRRTYSLFGDQTGSTELAVLRVTATLKPISVLDPEKKGRRVYELEAAKLGGRLTLVVSGKPDEPHRLVVRDADRNVEAVLPLRHYEIPLPPCHPGCFPAGTVVNTPTGPKAIETIRAGDVVLNVAPDGKTSPVKVASVFAGQSLLVEVETEQGKLVTTAKQPLLLVGDHQKGAGDLKAGDEIVRWEDGKPQPVKVRGVRRIDTPARVFNLVLEVRGTFVANGYLVRSKPPAER
jgi:hypothetical protein